MIPAPLIAPVIHALGVRYPFPPWRGEEAVTTQEAWREALRTAADAAGLAAPELKTAAETYQGQYWPTPADLVSIARQRRAPAQAGHCYREAHRACDAMGLVKVAVHWRDGASDRVDVFGVRCDCERGRVALAKENEGRAQRGERPNLDVVEYRAAWEASGKLLAFYVAPTREETFLPGDPRARRMGEDRHRQLMGEAGRMVAGGGR